MGGGGSKSKPEYTNAPVNPYKIAKEDFANYDKNDNKYITIDKILSVWIYIYFLLYYFNLIKYNPIILVLLALFFQIFIIIVLLYYSIYNKILVYIFIILFIKLLMLYGLYYKKKLYITIADMVFTIIFIIVYLVYISLFNETPYNIYKDLLDGYIDDTKGRKTSIRYYLNN
jgi:hypothetical protein